MTDQQPTPIIVQHPGVVSVATDTIGALKSSPMLLVIILLNCAFIASAAWYLNNQQHALERTITNILSRCLPDVHGDAYIVPPGGVAKVPSPQGDLRDAPPQSPPPPFEVPK